MSQKSQYTVPTQPTIPPPVYSAPLTPPPTQNIYAPAYASQIPQVPVPTAQPPQVAFTTAVPQTPGGAYVQPVPVNVSSYPQVPVATVSKGDSAPTPIPGAVYVQVPPGQGLAAPNVAVVDKVEEDGACTLFLFCLQGFICGILISLFAYLFLLCPQCTNIYGKRKAYYALGVTIAVVVDIVLVVVYLS